MPRSRQSQRPNNRPRATARRGFTLIEAAYTTVILGVGVVAMVDAQQSFVRSNNWSNESSTAAFLAGEVRELMRTFPNHDPVGGLFLDASAGGALTGWGPEDGELVVTDFDDVDDFDGLTFTWIGTDGTADGDLPGPINAFGEVIPEIDPDGIVVTIVDPADANATLNQPVRGWSQVVEVEKVLPHDSFPVPALTDDYTDAFRDVDDFPLRVTVTVFNQFPEDPAPREVTSMTWIMP